MGISISQYRSAIGLFRRPPANMKEFNDSNSYKSMQRGKINIALGLINVISLLSIIVLHSTTSELSLSASLIAHQCLQALLAISGVEQNPGPVSQQNVIEELCSKSTNDVVHKILRAYPLGQTFFQQKKAINKFLKEELILVLDFLKLSNQEKYNKPQVVHNLIVRIQNLLPDTCGLCKQEYNTGLEDIPLLTCDVCGQGSHNPCVISILGVGEHETDSLDPEKARKSIIPLDLPGVHYLCMTCSNDNIPNDNEGILNKKAHDIVEMEKSSDETVTHEPEGENISPENAVNTEDRPIATPIQQPHGVSGTQEPSQSPNPNQRADSTTAICPFYRKGTCKHGISGKGCKNQHPQPCKKLIKHGAKASNGCILGRTRCDRFHPSMCSSSMTKGECLDPTCKLWHVSGTKKSAKPTSRDQKPGKKQAENRPSKENPNDFLDILQRWKKEMMEAMDTKLAMAIKPPFVPSPRLPSLETIQMVGQNHIIPQNYYNPVMGIQRNVMTSGQPVLVQMAPNSMYP